ncbi:MAG: XdhC family protein [Bacteroidetes bacterium]|nr:XdhC family protein [Bacteroidota bacterium]
MKEINSIIKAYSTIDFSNTKAALATVARVEGSSYRRTGARMLVLDNGSWLGGISGGCLEGDALRRARHAIVRDRPSVVTYDTTHEDGHEIGAALGCNGIIDVLFTPLDPADGQNPVHLLSGLTDTRVPRVLVSVTGADAAPSALGKTLLYENDTQFTAGFPLPALAPMVLADIAASLEQHRSKTVSYVVAANTELKVFIEVIAPVTQLVVYGGNYDIYPLLRMSGELGWNSTLVVNLHKAPKAMAMLATQALHNKGEEQPVIDDYTAVLLMSHDYKTDFANLQQVLKTPAPYIGLLGPRKRSAKMFDALAQEGRPLTDADRQRIFSPMGLDIGASTPEEIALSILAEVRSFFAGRQGMPLRQRDGTIYGD